MTKAENMFAPSSPSLGSVTVGHAPGRDAYVQLLVRGTGHRVTLTRDQLLRLASDALQAALER